MTTAMKKLSHIFAIISIALLFSECHSGKKAVTATTTPPSTSAGTFMSTRQWHDVEVPVNIEISSPVNFSISGRARMSKDRNVDISLRMLGFEVGRLYADRDSVFGYVKMSKAYFAESLAELTGGLEMNISNVQDLLMGQLFLLGETELTESSLKKEFDIDNSGSGIMIIPRKQPEGFEYGFMTDKEYNPLRFVAGNNARNIQAIVSYSGNSGHNLDFAQHVGINVDLPKHPVLASLNWRWESARWDNGNESAFSIPKGCKRIRASQLLSNLSN